MTRLVRSLRCDDGTQMRFYSINESQGRPAFACFVKLAANRDDEWAMAALGVIPSPPDDQTPAEVFVEWMQQEWADALEEGNGPYFLRRGILYGKSIEEIGQDPTRHAMAFDVTYDQLTQMATNALAQLPTETVRGMRNRFEGGRRRRG